MQKAIFGAGCFWGVEEAFRKVKGVISTTVGYSGGTLENPTYEAVCTDKTGHAEVVQIEFDPKIVSYKKLLDVFWMIHDPTTSNRQGEYVGSQYRSVIFTHDDAQMNEALKSKEQMELQLKNKIMTEISFAQPFYCAEDYHQQFLAKYGQLQCHI